MLAIPDMTSVDITFGNIKHMPKQSAIPEEFKSHRGTPFNVAVSTWFFQGASGNGESITIGDQTFIPKDGVDGLSALAAIRAVLASFEPKHEHKESACAYMLSQWFDMVSK